MSTLVWVNRRYSVHWLKWNFPVWCMMHFTNHSNSSFFLILAQRVTMIGQQCKTSQTIQTHHFFNTRTKSYNDWSAMCFFLCVTHHRAFSAAVLFQETESSHLSDELQTWEFPQNLGPSWPTNNPFKLYGSMSSAFHLNLHNESWLNTYQVIQKENKKIKCSTDPHLLYDAILSWNWN